MAPQLGRSTRWRAPDQVGRHFDFYVPHPAALQRTHGRRRLLGSTLKWSKGAPFLLFPDPTTAGAYAQMWSRSLAWDRWSNKPWQSSGSGSD
ncbi:hypothetical protein NDU88_002997 [Pleurodeles waltl]|uniref:Uncharacterized protein n=1 Tax=Pleurodeles waltl TaxID=8319 RepID=A0AAV7W171_PLEWA|nr:hypothetical protein NDU88_002997 [Pleurodeles waltl]